MLVYEYDPKYTLRNFFVSQKKCALSYFFLNENLSGLPLISPFMIQAETKTFLQYEEQQCKTVINGDSHFVSFLENYTKGDGDYGKVESTSSG